MRRIAVTTAFALMLCIPGLSNAAVVINAVESGGNVLFTYSGSINLSGLGTPLSPANNGSVIAPTLGSILFGNGATMNAWTGSYTFPAFGSGGVSGPNGVTGPGFSIYSDGFGIFDTYVSGDSLSGSMTFDTSTFASLGVLPGVYTANLPNDTVTLNIKTVPDPATIALVGVGLLGLGFSHRKRAS